MHAHALSFAWPVRVCVHGQGAVCARAHTLSCVVLMVCVGRQARARYRRKFLVLAVVQTTGTGVNKTSAENLALRGKTAPSLGLKV